MTETNQLLSGSLQFTDRVRPSVCRVLTTAVLFVVQPACANSVNLDLDVPGFQSISGIHEPSGVIQLPDRRLLIVEDEPSSAFMLMTPKQAPGTFSVEHLRTRPTLSELLTGSSPTFNDLEGIVQGNKDTVYAVSSHSRQENGKRNKQREKLVRLSIDHDGITQLDFRGDLRNALVNAFPVLQISAQERNVKNNAGLNIEGIAFDQSHDSLWIGFRAPLIDDHAILVSLKNPDSVFDNDSDFKFDNTIQLLDLDNGGIRDIVFDAELNGYLIISQRERTKKEKAFKLWFWNGTTEDSPRRVRIKGINDLRRTEGIAPIQIGQEKRLLLVSDEGDIKHRKSAKFLLVKYEDLVFDKTGARLYPVAQ